MNKLERDLNSLGTDPLAIANRLMDLGIRGNREDTCGCCIGNYLSMQGCEDVFVQHDKVKAFVGMTETVAVLPEPVRSFLREFDHGCFPELVR